MEGNSKAVSSRDLSRRESEILALAAQGLTDKAIAARLGISYGTVNTHWSRIRPKLSVGSRSEAVFVQATRLAEGALQQLSEQNALLEAEVRKREESESKLLRDRCFLRALASKFPGVVWAVDRQGRPTFIGGGDSDTMEVIGEDIASPEVASFVSVVAPEGELSQVVVGLSTVTETAFGRLRIRTEIYPFVSAHGQVVGAWGVSTVADLDPEEPMVRRDIRDKPAAILH